MARYILVQVDDNDKADRLLKKLAPLVTSGVEVVGFYGKPTRFCECPRPPIPTARHPKYGWVLCSRCRGASRCQHAPRNLSVEGENRWTLFVDEPGTLGQNLMDKAILAGGPKRSTRRGRSTPASNDDKAARRRERRRARKRSA